MALVGAESWRRIRSLKAEGIMYCCQYSVIQILKQGRGGRIIGS